MSSALDTGRGIYQPTTSTVEYASLLGRWMGLTEPELRTVFPDYNSNPTVSELS